MAFGLALALVPAIAFGETISFTGGPYNTWNPGPLTYGFDEGDIHLTLSATSGGQAQYLGYKYETGNGNIAEGIGVYGGFAGGEIDPGEELIIGLVDNAPENRPVYLTSFTVNFLYYEYTSRGRGSRYFEGLKYSTDGGANYTSVFQSDFGQTYPNPFTPGELIVSFGPGVASSDFRLRSSGQFDHDFTLNQITAVVGEGPGSEIPEPGTLILLGSAAGAYGLIRRRRRREVK